MDEDAAFTPACSYRRGRSRTGHRRHHLPVPPVVRRGLAGLIVGRIGVNGALTVVYPYLTLIAAGLGVSLQVVGLLVAGRSLLGLAGPLIARLVSPRRRRGLLVASLLLVVAGCALVVSAPPALGAWRGVAVATGFLATGLARPLFDLPAQTWVSVHVPLPSRGRAIGLTELAWALSMLATVPLAGALLDRFDWRSPFLVAAGFAMLGAVAVGLAVPRENPGAPTPPAAPPLRAWPLTQRAWRRTTRIPTGAAVCLAAGLTIASIEQLLVVYGAWLEQDFGLSAAQIGASTTVIVVAELLGAGLVVFLADRLGLCRAVMGALAASALAYTVLGLLDAGPGAALAMVLLGFVTFEVTVVALVAFATTIYHRESARSRLLGWFMAAVAVGNAAGAALAPLSFEHGGIQLTSASSAAAMVVAAVILGRGLRARELALAPARVHDGRKRRFGWTGSR